MLIGITRETFPGERRVALLPESLAPLKKAGVDFLVEPGAGAAAGFSDQEFADKGASVAASRKDLFDCADLVVQVRTVGANPVAGAADLDLMRSGLIIIGMSEPLTAAKELNALAQRGVTLFALELMPRITRAQSMDVLSSMATIAGYKAVLMAADRLTRMFPILMTAAGTVKPARVLVIGAGVAGLQAIATAKRLGAVVTGYDVRPAVKEQVESLGAKFLELPLETAAAEDKGGYAKELGEETLRRQREMMAKAVADSDVVITTAAVPGKRAPLLITTEMLKGMAPGSVVVDLAAERGGNCEPTELDKDVRIGGVTILGPSNLPSTIPFHASQMFARNVAAFLKHLVKDGTVNFDMNDEITRETLVIRNGEILNERARQLVSGQ